MRWEMSTFISFIAFIFPAFVVLGMISYLASKLVHKAFGFPTGKIVEVSSGLPEENSIQFMMWWLVFQFPLVFTWLGSMIFVFVEFPEIIQGNDRRTFPFVVLLISFLLSTLFLLSVMHSKWLFIKVRGGVIWFLKSF
jgi:hypothetical protein